MDQQLPYLSLHSMGFAFEDGVRFRRFFLLSIIELFMYDAKTQAKMICLAVCPGPFHSVEHN
jgi:hypothetical protein